MSEVTPSHNKSKEGIKITSPFNRIKNIIFPRSLSFVSNGQLGISNVNQAVKTFDVIDIVTKLKILAIHFQWEGEHFK